MSEGTKNHEWGFRLAQPQDAPAFSKWAGENSQIDLADLTSTLKAENPTTLFFVAEKNGVAVAFAPVYCQMHLAHLAFNPEARSVEKLKALETLIDGTTAFAVRFGIREITTLTKDNYLVAEWAAKHGFDREERQTYTLRINKILEQTGKEKVSCE